MIRHHHLISGTIAVAAALMVSLAPAAWADPAPLAKAEAEIAASSQPSAAVRPNPDEQKATGASANPGPCSEVCSGGARSYGPASLYSTASTPPTVIRVSPPNGGFAWGDTGIGAAGGFALAMLGIGGALAISQRRTRRALTS